MSNTFTKLTFDPISPHDVKSPQDAARLTNDRISRLVKQLNNSLSSMKIDLRDIGYEVKFSVPKYSTESPPWGTDIPVPHGMGIVPRRFIVWDIQPAKKAGPLPTALTDGDLWRGFNQWNSKHVFFQISQNAWFGECTFTVLLFP